MLKNKTIIRIICPLILTSISGVYSSSISQISANETRRNQPIYLAQNQLKNSLEGTEWQLVAWHENQPLTDKSATLTFDKERVFGTGGCNRYTAGYEQNDNRLKVDVIAATRMACPEEIMTQEMLFLAALEGAKIYTINSQGQLQIAYIKQKQLGIITFKPLSKSNTPTTEKTVYISPETVDCIGVAPKKCLQIKETPGDNWTLFYESIEGFTYEPGYNYQVRIAQKKILTLR
ncbi:META and DUF4377 domain-containing protein [Crocosphaera sp. UHCC 0190]|uniref:META and DUF4377 domain-containing protein n=1 Tax=Crocosphaera sp. UHCC 0190 TaxID=3110246 RepID=UPI002B212EA9|nr:META and DUF4377 domain-containing protein [Crocosphaera sp. UHCC 0190]MEA5511637.1 META and DUF4377 domain-containing protein [Crocosphaera sp. UHCC 0190]